MIKSIIFLFIFIISLAVNASSPKPSDTTYNLVDLEVLENDRSYLEFFHHAKDLRPRERNNSWKKMVLSMALGLMTQLNSPLHTLTGKEYELLLKISSWSSLTNNEFYIKQRDILLIKYYRQCFKAHNNQSCYNKAVSFFNKYKTHIEFGHLFSKVVINSTPKSVQYDLWPFVKKLVQHPISEFYCHKDTLFKTISYKLYALATTTSNFQINNYIHPDCWKVIKDRFSKNLLTVNDPYTRLKTYKILENNGHLTKKLITQYNILQMLSGLHLNNKETLNAWNNLKKLSQNYLLREEIFNSIKKYIPLPGNVFIGATKQQKLIVKAFANYFPEYIDFYAKSCLDHLSGRVSTLGGNPATRCHEFFKLSKLQNIIPKSKTLQYTQLMKY